MNSTDRLFGSWHRLGCSWKWACLLCLVFPLLTYAGEIVIRNPQLLQTEDGLALSAEVDIELGSKIEDALVRGLPLYFSQEFEMSRPRWYWFEDKRFSRTQALRLYYHALTRQYRVGIGPIHQSFSTLGEALASLTHMRHWTIIDRNEQSSLKAGETYQAVLRFRLDGSQLPRPLQINVLFARDWELGGETRWAYTVPDPR